MARKKRGSAAARAAKARATRESQKLKRQEIKESVPEPDPDMDSSTVSEAEDSTTSQSEVQQLEETTPPPPPPTTDAPDAPPDDPPEVKDDNVELIQEATLPEKEDAVTPDKKDPIITTTEKPADMEVENEKNYYLDTLLTDKSYLIDVSLGYTAEENLKQPLKGFTTEDELQLFPVIESMSAKLYTIVQKMNACQKKDVEAVIKSRKGIIKIPNMLIRSYLCHVNYLEPPTEADKAVSAKRAPHPFLLTEDENMFSEDKLKLLRAVLDAGWKREVVMRSPGSTGRKTGDVYYYAPDGTKFRSSKQVEKHLAEQGASPFTIENFTFAKVRISTNPEQEIVRKAYDGKSPPRSPPKPVSSKSKAPPASKGESSRVGAKASTSTSKESLDSADNRAGEEPMKGVSSRRSIQPPKRYSGDAVLLLSKRSKVQEDKHRNANANKGMMQMGMLPPKYPKGMEDSSSKLPEGMELTELGYIDEGSSASKSVAMKEIAEDSLFQISALRQSGGIDVANMQQMVENHKQMAKKAQAALIKEEHLQGTKAGGSKRGAITVIPCSIRCPGMEGAVPNLQCIRCLCLFHAECLGLPPNLAFNKYLCSNCTDQQTTSNSAPTAATSQKSIMKKPSDVKRSPPGLAPIAHGNLRGPAPGRDITVTLATKEGHTRLPQKMVPSSVGVARGMIRSRGMPPPHVRSPSTHMHHGQRMMTSDGAPSSMMGAHPQIMKRGRGRPPSVPQSRPLPQLSKNLTITHLPRIPGPPPVPNLQSMVTPKAHPGKLPIPTMMGGAKPRQVMPAVPNLMKSNAFRLAVPPPSLSGRTFKKIVSPSHHHTPTNLRLSATPAVVNKSAAVVYTHAASPDRTASLVKRYPQSVCTIGNKKFVVLPKRRPADFAPALVSTVGNGGLSKGITIDAMRHSETTIKKIVAIGDQMNSTDGAKNNMMIDEPMDDGSTEAVSTDDTTPMEEGEEGGIDIRTASNESISANQ